MITTHDSDTQETHGYCKECGQVGWMDDDAGGLCEQCATNTQMKRTIIHPGDGHPPVECYGEWKDDSNASAVFDDEWIDNIYCNDDDCQNWTEVVKVLAAYAKRCNTTLIELSSC